MCEEMNREPTGQGNDDPDLPGNSTNSPSYIDPDIYFRERTKLIEIETKSAEQYDKAMLTLSAGALALSITFVEKIAPNPDPNTNWLIGWSWICFIIAMLGTVSSFLTSQAACRKQRDLWDKRVKGINTTPIDQEKNSFSDATRWFNGSSFFFFFVGVILLAIFSFENLPSGKKTAMSKEKKQPDIKNVTDPQKTGAGVVPPKPPVNPRGSDSPKDSKKKKDK